MKIRVLIGLFVLALAYQTAAQRSCSTFEYQQRQLHSNPTLLQKIESIEIFTKQIEEKDITYYRSQGDIIVIPVVVHILYHYPYENISDARVQEQIAILNRDFRRMNADTVNTPSGFKNLAADCEIEFKLATVDPKKRATTGIVRKYTPIKLWSDDDKMKFSNEMGDDAWDADSYLNIWVCELDRVAGYASFPGGPIEKDGVVLDFGAFGVTNNGPYSFGRTAVHEIGHWLNLKHTWGDSYCGDDLVHDTPKQSTYTVGCPSSIRITCGNGPNGDMYMNYMDFTNDECMNLFTEGQKMRMKSLFEPGGARHSILSSNGLGVPLIQEIPLPEVPPRWLHVKIYPVPAKDELTIDIAYDERWIGKIITIYNQQGQPIMRTMITSKIQKINTGNLKPGIYFLSAKKEDGEMIREKFIKL